MRYIIDHDYHIHTSLSLCTGGKGPSPSTILENAKRLGLKRICITDHYWDEKVPCHTAVNGFYKKQNYAHIAQSLPLPQEDGIHFMFGCEADMDNDDAIGLSPSRYDAFDFIIVSTTHFHHMSWGAGTLSNRELAWRWITRVDVVLNADLPFGKVGIGHLTRNIINLKLREDYLDTLRWIPDEELVRIFTKAADLGLGIELNAGEFAFTDSEADTVLRIHRTAKACGCKFYLGSDAHGIAGMSIAQPRFERAITLLNLKESDKFIINSEKNSV